MIFFNGGRKMFSVLKKNGLYGCIFSIYSIYYGIIFICRDHTTNSRRNKSMSSEDFSYLPEAGSEKGDLIRGLQLVQSREGYVSDEAISAVSRHFGIPEAEVEGVLTFYAQFKRVKPGKYKISICDGTACHIKGSTQVSAWLTAELGISDGQTTEDGLFSIETVACLGCCSLAPVMAVNGKVYGKLDRKGLTRILNEYKKLG